MEGTKKQILAFVNDSSDATTLLRLIVKRSAEALQHTIIRYYPTWNALFESEEWQFHREKFRVIICDHYNVGIDGRRGVAMAKEQASEYSVEEQGIIFAGFSATSQRDQDYVDFRLPKSLSIELISLLLARIEVAIAQDLSSETLKHQLREAFDPPAETVSEFKPR